MLKPIIISGPKVYTENALIENSSVHIRKDLITAIHPESSTVKATYQFPQSYHLLPGFMDLHIHGSHGADVMDANKEALPSIAAHLAKEGTTSFLATTMTEDAGKIESALTNISECIFHRRDLTGACILGVHLEGPFISVKKAGAQQHQYILPPNIEYMKKWQQLSNFTIKMVTLAPELPESAAFIRYLKTQNVVISAGHTDATFEDAQSAIANGLSYATHLFNAMKSIHHRNPSLVTACLLSDKVMTEIIADGKHVHPAILQLIYKIKSEDKIILVTDAIRAKCMPEGRYDLGGQEVTVTNNLATLHDGTLAGSVLSLPSALKNMMEYSGCSLSAASKMISANPARALGIFHERGSITPGKKADITILDEKLNVVLTMSEGRVIYER